MSSNSSCGFVGNSDVYGLGIRVGYYTQAIAAWYANFFFLQDAKLLRVTNSLFIFALAIAIVVYIYHSSAVHAIEVFLLLNIEFCLLLTTISPRTRFSSRYMPRSWGKTALYASIRTAILAYGTYYWWYGMDTMLITNCGTYVMWFARVDLFGTMRQILKYAYGLSLLWTVLYILPLLIGRFLFDLGLRDVRASFIKAAKAIESSRSSASPTTSATVVSHVARSRWGVPAGSSKFGLRPARRIRNTLHPSFENIWDCERYLGDVLATLDATNQPQRPRSTKRGLFAVKLQALLQKSGYSSFRPFLQDSALCLLSALSHIGRLWIAPVVVAAHSSKLKRPHYLWPRTWRKMQDRNNSGLTPDWRILAIASDIQLSQLPLYIGRQWILLAVQSFLFAVALILQTELTIYWNQISGLTDVSTVGQLIPLITGIVGLLSVLWGKWRQLKSGKSEAQETAHHAKDDYQKAMTAYIEWKRERDQVPPTTGPTSQSNGATSQNSTGLQARVPATSQTGPIRRMSV